jgi:Trehalose utilisation
MHRTRRTFCLSLMCSVLGLCAALPTVALAADAAPAAAAPAAGGKKKVVFLAGGRSHGYGSHDHLAGSHILAKRIKEVPGFDAVVVQGWPKDESVLDGAAAVVMYSDGGGGHFAVAHLDKLKALNEKGAGIGALHYAVEVVKGTPGKHWLEWMGGYFETFWSINPHWMAEFKELPGHAVARGVKPFKANDEWYYNMRFRENMEGVTPILSAVPPDETRKRGAGPHSGNPEVSKGVGKNQKEHVLWVSENANGTRGFGCTGGHFHRNWAHDQFRKTVLNSIVWIAKGDVPAGGIESKRPDLEEMMANHDETPKEQDKAKLKKEYEEIVKAQEDAARAEAK